MPLQVTIYRAKSSLPDLPGTDLFHSTELFRLYEATPGYAPLLVVAREEGQVIGKLLGVVRRSVRLTPPAFIRRCEIYGTGEYFCPNDRRETIFAELLNRLTEEALHHSFLIEFRNLEDAKFGYRLSVKTNIFPSTG